MIYILKLLLASCSYYSDRYQLDCLKVRKGGRVVMKKASMAIKLKLQDFKKFRKLR